MPTHTPPDSQAVDFALESYTPADSDAGDFELAGGVLSAPVQEWELTQPQASVSGTGMATVSAATETWQWSQPDAMIARVTLVQPPVQDWTLTQPAAVVQLVQRWSIDGTLIDRATAETATPSTLSLTFRVSTDDLLDTLRALKSDEGKVSVLPTDDGGFVAVDRANGANTFTLSPPARRTPLRIPRTAHVDRYEEELVSQDVGEWSVELEFVVGADRTDTPSISESPAADEWGLTTRYGTIATDRVDAEVLGTGADGVERFELTLRLDRDQAHVFEAAVPQIRGTRVKEVPDAPNVMVDETGGNATLTVDAPDGQNAVSDGDYVVTDWESRRVTDRYQEITVTLASST